MAKSYVMEILVLGKHKLINYTLQKKTATRTVNTE